MQVLHEETKGDAIITTGVGQHQMWAAQYYKFDQPRQWATSGGLGSMGFGLPSALGAAMAYDGTDGGRPKKVRSSVIVDRVKGLRVLLLESYLDLQDGNTLVGRNCGFMLRCWSKKDTGAYC